MKNRASFVVSTGIGFHSYSESGRSVPLCKTKGCGFNCNALKMLKGKTRAKYITYVKKNPL